MKMKRLKVLKPSHDLLIKLFVVVDLFVLLLEPDTVNPRNQSPEVSEGGREGEESKAHGCHNRRVIERVKNQFEATKVERLTVLHSLG